MDLPVLLSPALPFLPAPERYRFPFDTSFLLLTIPTRLANCIAFLMHDNVLRRMVFGGGEIHITDVGADYFRIVSGGSLAPVLPGPYAHACIYLQSRRLVVYDIAKKSCEAHTITDMRNLEELASAAHWISQEPKTLAVQIDDTERYDQGLVDVRLRSFDLSASQARPLGVLEMGTIPPRRFQWHAGQGIVLTVRDQNTEIFDAALTSPLDHPLASIARGLREKIRGAIPSIYIHPERPCAIFTSAEQTERGTIFGLHLATWDERGTQCTWLAVAPPGMRLRLHSLSQDGNFLACSVENAEECIFYLLPMNLEPQPPLVAGVATDIHSCCFIRAPAAFVVFERGGAVLRWRLDKLSSV